MLKDSQNFDFANDKALILSFFTSLIANDVICTCFPISFHNFKVF